jgi:hypothetical protein
VIRAKTLKRAEKVAIRKWFFVSCECVRPISNIRVAIRNSASCESQAENSDASSVKCARKHAIFDRLEKVMLLFSGELRAFLIAVLSIRKLQ